MKRYNRFKMLNDIQDDYILESMPNYEAAQKKKLRSGNAFTRFLSSGWCAACVCAVVALAVMVFIIRAGQDPWSPPAGTVEESSHSSENTTEEETKSHALTEYQGMTADIPYKLSYSSNGDGTCWVNGVTVNMLYKDDFVLDIPETSPDGETVVGVSIKSTHNIPVYLIAEDFEKIKTAVLEFYDNDENNFYFKQFMSYFLLKGLEICSTEQPKSDLLAAYPVAAYTNVYVFDITATDVEYALRSRTLSEATPWYTAERCYADMLKLKDLATKNGITDPLLEQALALHSGNFESVTEIKLPKTLMQDGLYLPTIAAIGFESVTFDGTMEELAALCDPQDITLAYPLTIHCTDGDLSYRTE